MRGGLDDALDKLARRDQLRRRSSGEAPGTPAAVTELVEAIAAVVGHHPGLGVSVGVEGAGEPLLLHFFFADGQVQVNAENAMPEPGEPGAPRHADFDVDADEPPSPPFDYPQPDPYQAESDTAERYYGSFDDPPPAQHQQPGESSRDLGARMRDLGMATTRDASAYPPHPFAPTPPPEVPPQSPSSPAQQTRRIQPEQYHAPAEPAAAERVAMPAPLPKPIPLQVERPEETEMAARRLAALLREDPSVLQHPQ